MAWTEERIEWLKTLRTAGYSASLIAAQMGGVTRNAVIGKLHRLGLTTHSETPSYRLKGWKRRPKNPKPPHKKPAFLYGQRAVLAKLGMTALERDTRPAREVFVTPEAERKTILELEPHHCRFPFGEEQFTFCARTKVQGLSYCADHAPACHVVSRPRPPTASEFPKIAPQGIASAAVMEDA